MARARNTSQGRMNFHHPRFQSSYQCLNTVNAVCRNNSAVSQQYSDQTPTMTQQRAIQRTSSRRS